MKFGLRHNFEFSQLTDQIYLGKNMCCAHHFLKLKDLGIAADIDLEQERGERPQGVEFYLRLPVKDHSAPTQDQLAIGAAVIRQLVAAGKKVYVHCKNGHGRAPTLLAAYLILTGKGLQEAVEFIKVKRPGIHLEESQLAALGKFQRLKRR